MNKRQITNSKNYKRKLIPNQIIYKIQRIQLLNYLIFFLNFTLGFPGSNIKPPALNIYPATIKPKKIKAHYFSLLNTSNQAFKYRLCYLIKIKNYTIKINPISSRPKA